MRVGSAHELGVLIAELADASQAGTFTPEGWDCHVYRVDFLRQLIPAGHPEVESDTPLARRRPLIRGRDAFEMEVGFGANQVLNGTSVWPLEEMTEFDYS